MNLISPISVTCLGKKLKLLFLFFSDTYFRKTGLERSASISKDLEWFRQQGIDIPQPSSPGVTYATYLEELSEKSAPSFLCHLYNIYFAHISGGQAIGRQVASLYLRSVMAAKIYYLITEHFDVCL